MEIWKELERFPGYEVSNLGRVKSNKGKTPKFLKIVKNNRGYDLVCLFHNKKRYTGYIHRLVAEAFIPTGLDILTAEVNHIDKDTSNNSIDNLEWTTYKMNLSHKLNPERYQLFRRLEKALEMLSDNEIQMLVQEVESNVNSIHDKLRPIQ